MSSHHQQSGGNRSTTNTTSYPSPQQPNLEQQQQSANQRDQFPNQQHFHSHTHSTRSHTQPTYQHQQQSVSGMSPPAHLTSVPSLQHSSQLPTSSFNSTPQHHHPSTDYDTSQLASNVDETEDDGLREQDRLLPIANVSRIMKQAVPPAAKISKDAKDTVQECVSEFIAFITSEAADRCTTEKRKTINGEDIVWAMEQLGFDQYAHLMKLYLLRYREATKTNSDSPGKLNPGVQDSPQLINTMSPNLLFDQGGNGISLLPMQPHP